ncbi:MAG: NADH-quinone oxidoreductase subunit M [Myxococcota bacterium]
METFPLLSALLFLPLVASVTMTALRDERVARLAAWAFAGVELLLAGVMILRFQSGVPGPQLVENGFLIPGLGVQYHLGVDGISALFVPVAALMTLLMVLHTDEQAGGARQNLASIFAMEASTVGVLVSLDLGLWWLFLTLEVWPAYLVIRRWGTGERRHEVARRFAAFMAVSVVTSLAAVVWLRVQGAGRPFPLSVTSWMQDPLAAAAQEPVFLLLLLALAIRIPVFPFHTWLPQVVEHGPLVGVTVFFLGLKVGAYSLLRVVIPVLPDAAQHWAWLMAGLGVAGLLHGGLIAMVEPNLRRMLAFASVSHVGGVLLGIASLTMAGFQGALLQMLSLGVCVVCLFFLAGFLQRRTGAVDAPSLGGLVHRVPRLSVVFLVMAMACVGMPGTSGFNGEHLIMLGALRANWLWGLAAGVGTLLSAAYFLIYFQRAFIRAPVVNTASPISDLTAREWLTCGTLCALVFWCGLFTGPFLDVMNGSLKSLAHKVDRRAHTTVTTLEQQPGSNHALE